MHDLRLRKRPLLQSAPIVARLVGILLQLVALTVPSVVGAQDGGDQERARLHFQSGASYYDTGDYEMALQEFQRSYDLSRKAELFYNLSLTYERMGDLQKATEFLRRYLAEATNVADRVTMETRLGNFERRLDQKRQEDAARQATLAAEALERSQREGEEIARREAAEREAAAAQAAQEHAESQPQEQTAPQTEAALAESTVANEPDTGGGLNSVSIAGFAVGGAGLATFGITAGLAYASFGELSEGCVQARTCQQSDVDRVENLSLIADIGLGVAAAGAIIGIVFLFVDLEDADESHAAVAPWIGQDVVGAVAAGTF